MTHDEIIAKVNDKDLYWFHHRKAVLAVVELHKPDKEGLCAMNCVDVDDDGCGWTHVTYPCPTIQAIERELV